MTMHPFAHANATSLPEALEALGPDCRPLAGGTDLVGLMKEGLAAPARLVNLKTVPGLGNVETRDGGLYVGALATLSTFAAAPGLAGRPEYACLVEALLNTASPQLRHMATLGGNLLQAPRCWYYRNPLTPCWRKGGTLCYAFRGENAGHVILGGGPCYAVHPSDPAVALLALEAEVTLASPRGARRVPLAELYHTPNRQDRGSTTVAADELVTEVAIPAPQLGSRGAYVKVAERATWDFALASAAVQCVLEDGAVRRARIALGGVATIPWRATEVERALEGQALTPEAIAAAAEAATAGARPLAQNAYKADLTQAVVRQALERLAAP